MTQQSKEEIQESGESAKATAMGIVQTHSWNLGFSRSAAYCQWTIENALILQYNLLDRTVQLLYFKKEIFLKISFASGRFEGTSGGKEKVGTEQFDKCLYYKDGFF